MLKLKSTINCVHSENKYRPFKKKRLGINDQAYIVIPNSGIYLLINCISIFRNIMIIYRLQLLLNKAIHCVLKGLFHVQPSFEIHSSKIFIEHYAIITLKLKKIVTLIHGVWYKMLYHHSVILKGWCDFLCHTTSSCRHNIGV